MATAVAMRGHGSDGLWRMLGFSVVGHGMALAALVLVPGLLGVPVTDAEREVMTISLGGAPGPRAGGMTPLGGRPIQQTAPPPPRPEPVRPPAAKPPEMVAPAAKPARPARTPPPKVASAPEEARGTTPTRGPREQLGSAVAQTGGQGAGLGLSTGGGGTGGEISLGDFCCPEYLSTMLQLIQRNWDEKQPVGGRTTMRFTIRRDGNITDISVARSSGYTALDLAAQRALGLTRLPPLPAAYTNPQLTLNLHFEYKR